MHLSPIRCHCYAKSEFIFFVMGNNILIGDSCGTVCLFLSAVIVALFQLQKQPQIKSKKSLLTGHFRLS